MVGELLAHERIGAGRRREHGSPPARRPRSDDRLRQHGRLRPDEERRRSRTPRFEHLRREVARRRRERDPRGDRLRRRREGSGERLAPRLPVVRVVGQQRNLEALRDDVLGQTKRQTMVRGRDPEDVRAPHRVDEAPAALVGDPDRDVVAVGELPACVDAGPVRHDRHHVAPQRRPCVRNRLGR